MNTETSKVNNVALYIYYNFQPHRLLSVNGLLAKIRKGRGKTLLEEKESYWKGREEQVDLSKMTEL